MLSEEKKLPFYLREKLAPEVHRESGGTATENTTKVVLECLDGFFLPCCVDGCPGEQVCMSYQSRQWPSCMPLMLGCPGLGVLGQCPPFAFAPGLAAGVVLEGLRPQRVSVYIVNDHGELVAKAEDLWETPCLIIVHYLLKFIDANKYIIVAFVWGYGRSVREDVE